MKSIEVNIAGRVYPVKVTAEEESVVQGIVDEINRKVSDFQSTYRGKDKQDYLSMALLTYALESAQSREADASLEEVKTKADAIMAALESIG